MGGGVLVYSTCTVNPDENERQVRYALDTFPCLRLVHVDYGTAGRGLGGRGLAGLGDCGLDLAARDGEGAAASGDDEEHEKGGGGGGGGEGEQEEEEVERGKSGEPSLLGRRPHSPHHRSSRRHRRPDRRVLSERERRCVVRFNARAVGADRTSGADDDKIDKNDKKGSGVPEYRDDAVGFFVAKFVKVASSIDAEGRAITARPAAETEK